MSLSFGAPRKKSAVMSPRAKPMKYSASLMAAAKRGSFCSSTSISYPAGTMPRATSMMVFGRGGQNTILVATMLSFRLVKRLTAGSVHVQLERVAVRVLHVDRGATALADHWDAGGLQPL